MRTRGFHNIILAVLPLGLVVFLAFACDDKPVFGTSRTIDVPGKSLSVQLRRDYHQSGFSTLNVLVQGLTGNDALSAILVGDQPIEVWSVEEQQAFPQDTVYLDLYAKRKAASYEAQIRYKSVTDSAAFLIMINSEIVLNQNINIRQGLLLKEMQITALLKPPRFLSLPGPSSCVHPI